MADPEVAATLKKVSSLVSSMVEPVTAALEEITRARKARQRSLVAVTCMAIVIAVAQFWVVSETRRVLGELSELDKAQRALGEQLDAQREEARQTAEQIQALLRFAAVETRNARVREDLKEAQKLAPKEGTP